MRKHKRKWWVLGTVLFVIAVAGIWYWGQQRSTSRTLRIILIQKTVDESDFWASISEGAEMAAKENNTELMIWGPKSEREVDSAHQMILDAIEEKPDAIVLAPSSYEKTLPYARKIEEAGIPLILMDSSMAEPAGESIVATDNVKGGCKMGEYMRQFVDEDTVIGVVGHVKGSSTAVEREAGFRQGLGDAEEKIVDVVFCESSYELAYEVTVDMLERHPEINMLAGLNEYSAVGAARAVSDLGLQDKIRMVGFDSSQEEIQFLEAGVFDAIVIQKPFNMGYLGVEKAAKIARGEEVEASVDSGSELITKENMYTEENQKLLFPFFGGE